MKTKFWAWDKSIKQKVYIDLLSYTNKWFLKDGREFVGIGSIHEDIHIIPIKQINKEIKK